MKIAIATIFYNNALELKRLLDSIPKGAIDYFIGVDGIFKYTKEQNPELSDLSDDGTQNFLLECSTSEYVDRFTRVIVSKTNSTEFEKRNTYLKVCEDLGDVDVLIITDTDEFFVYNEGTSPEQSWQRFKKNLEFEIRKYPGHNVYGIDFTDECGTRTYKPRVWVNPSEMRYIYGSHYHYANVQTENGDIERFRQNGICYLQQAQAIIKGLTLKHDHSLRSEEYLKRREQYQKYLISYESIIQQHKYSEEEADKLAKDKVN